MLISMFEIHANQSAAKLFAVDQTLVCKIVFTIPETQDRYWKQKTKLQGKEVYFHSKHADNVCCLSLVAEKHHIVICWSENTNLNPKNILHWGQENVSWYQNEATQLSPYVWHISLWLLHVLFASYLLFQQRPDYAGREISRNIIPVVKIDATVLHGSFQGAPVSLFRGHHMFTYQNQAHHKTFSLEDLIMLSSLSCLTWYPFKKKKMTIHTCFTSSKRISGPALSNLECDSIKVVYAQIF